jgi:asparagine synthase (glutamine-hydrolysing)
VLNGGSVGLAHVRLSIVDLNNGHQPLYNEDQSIAVICNGEIYDYRAHRQALIRLGHRFRTTSDSELLVHLYEQYGTDFCQRINGEFAGVIWDQRQRRLIAFKDAAGVKPLYYYRDDRELVLCSEVKGIYSLNRIDRRLSLDYLTGPAFGIFTPTCSPFQNVDNLRPGHYLVVSSDGSVQQHAHYVQGYQPDLKMTFEDAKAALKQQVTTAVRRRLAADVPVNSYLSGGIDSAIVCGLMAQEGPRFTAYNVGFPGSPYDESDQARHIAEFYGQRFETVPCDSQAIADNLMPAVFYTEMPLFNYNSVAKMILSRHVRRQGHKVCLTGEGSDELFAGYPYFKLEALWRMRQDPTTAGTERVDQLWRRFQQIEARSEGYLWDRSDRWRKATSVFGYPSYFQLRARSAGRCIRTLFDPQRSGLTRRHRPLTALQRSFDPAAIGDMHPLNITRLITLNQMYGVVIPALGDRVEMANSLECRPPFLDREVMQLAGAIPPQYLIDIDQLREKHLLRETFRSLLPPVFNRQHKHPFLSPSWATFARTPRGREIFGDFLSLAAVRRAGIFRPAAVALFRSAWNWWPRRRGLIRQIDVLMGTVMSIHMLHHLFVEQPIPSDPKFPMVDRSPGPSAVVPRPHFHMPVDSPSARRT